MCRNTHEEEMNMAVYEITFSPTGGTDKVTDILMEGCQEEKKEISLLAAEDHYGNYEFQKDDICFISMPSYGGRIPRIAAERLIQMKGNGAKAVLVCVYGNRAYEDTLIELKDKAEEAGFVIYGAVAEHSIMRKFAAGRLDAGDVEELRAFGKKLREKLEQEADLEDVKKVNEKKCIACMRCIAVCPKNVRKLNKVVLLAAETKMAKLFEERKGNELFL